MATLLQENNETWVVENEIGFDQSGAPYIVFTPQSPCCNCGTKINVGPRFTHFMQSSYFSIDDDDKLQFDLALPYCGSCEEQVGKYGTAAAVKFFVAILVWLLLVFASVLLLPKSMAGELKLILVFIAWPAAVVAVLRFLERPVAPMTAKYLPVKIKEFGDRPHTVYVVGIETLISKAISYVSRLIWQKVSGKNPHAIDTLTLDFSNPSYLRAFANANRKRLNDGTMRIKNMT